MKTLILIASIVMSGACGYLAQPTPAPHRATDVSTMSRAPTPAPTPPEHSAFDNLETGKTERIKFKPGKSAAVINATVETNKQNLYLLKVSQNQTLTVSIKSIKRAGFADTEQDASFRVLNARTGEPLEKKESDQWITKWSGKLPETGDYLIAVIGVTDNTWYTLKVAVR